MKNDNQKNIIIVLLVVIIIILSALVVLFATDTISFNSNTVNNNIQGNENDENNGETIDGNIQEEENYDDKKETVEVIARYQSIIQSTENHYQIYEFELKSDNTVNYIIGASTDEKHTNIGTIMNYSGTYLEKDNKIMLSIISTDDNCETGKYACVNSITLIEQNDGILVEKILVGEENISVKTFNKVDNLLLIK